MLPKETSFLALLVAIGIAGVLGSSGYSSYKVMSDKAQAQAQAVADFRKWKADYTTLLPVDERWKASLRAMSEAKDLLSLYGLLGPDSNINPDRLIVDKIESVKVQNAEVGASRVCMSSAQGAGVTLEAADFKTLFEGLDALAKRPDIQMGSVRFTQANGKARANVTGFCLVLREEEGGAK